MFKQLIFVSSLVFAAVAFNAGRNNFLEVKTSLMNKDSREWSLFISQIELPFHEAVTACEQVNATLLKVDSAEKDRILVDLFVNGGSSIPLPGNNSWIGTTESREGAWLWVPSGEPLYYSRWMVGQPDDLENVNCAYQAVQALLYWRDANCSAPMYFVCESY